MLPAQLYTQVPRGALGGRAGGVLLYELQRHQIVVARACGGKALLAAIGGAAEIRVLEAGELRGEELAGAGLDELLFGASLKLGDEVHTATARL